MLHGTKTAYCNPAAESQFMVESTTEIKRQQDKRYGFTNKAPTDQMLRMAQQTFAIIPVQQVNTSGNNIKVANMFFDNGSNLCLVRKKFTLSLELVGRPCEKTIETAGGISKDWRIW